MEPGETKRQALIRECKEELDIIVDVSDEYCHVVHEYNDVIVDLTLFNATILHGTPKLLEHVDMRWILPSEIDNFEFCPADVDILNKIKCDF